MKQWSIGSGPAGTLLVVGDPANPVQTLIQNVDTTNILYIGETAGVNPLNPLESVPVLPGQSVIATGVINVFGIAGAGQNVAVNTLRGFGSYFQAANLGNLGGASIYVQATAPAPPIALNSLWFAPDGSINVWNGSTWVKQQFAGNEIIQASTIYADQLAAGIIYAGIVDGTTVKAATFIGGTSLYYSSPNPALGTLIESDGFPSGTTDSVGNAVYGGSCSYKPVAGSGIASQVSQKNGGVLNSWCPNVIGSGSPGSFSTPGGQVAEIQLLSGGTASGDSQASLLLRSQNNYGDNPIAQLAAILAPMPISGLPGGTGPFIYQTPAGGLGGKSPGINGVIPVTQSDYTTFSNNTTSMNQMSRSWSVPAIDLYNNVAFRLTVWGGGTQGSSTQQLNTQLSGFGTTFGGNNMPSADLPSGNFHWQCEYIIIIQGTGLSWGGRFTWSQAAVTQKEGNDANHGSLASIPNVNTNITYQMGWGGAGCTVVCTGSLFERLAA